MKETDHRAGKKKSDSTYSAASMVGEIEDLLFNILLRLPAKSLMRFKCVSKQWLSLISSSQFGISHTRFHQLVNSTPSALLLVNGFKVADELRVLPLKLSSRSHGFVPSFDFVKVNRLQIIQSCNGLILCRSTFKIPGEDNYAIRGFVYWIYNPTTAQSKRLSFPSTLQELSRIKFLIGVGLAFDPISSPYYKIVFIFDLHKKGLQSFLVEIYVYSSENDSWNSQIVDVIGMSMVHVLPPTLAIGFQDGVFCKNGIHWLRYGAGTSLLCFPFDDWTMKKMHLPMELKVRYFGESEGTLHAIAYDSFGSYHGPNFQVLDIAPDYSRWAVKYNVNFEYIKREFPGDWVFSILSLISAKNEEPVIILSVGGKLMSYNLNDRTFKTIYEIEWRPELDRHKLDYEGEYYKHFENLICI